MSFIYAHNCGRMLSPYQYITWRVTQPRVCEKKTKWQVKGKWCWLIFFFFYDPTWSESNFISFLFHLVRLLYLPTVNGLLMLTNPRQQNLIVHVGFFQLRISLFQLSLFSPLCSETLYYADGIAEACLPGVLLVLDRQCWLARFRRSAGWWNRLCLKNNILTKTIPVTLSIPKSVPRKGVISASLAILAEEMSFLSS